MREILILMRRGQRPVYIHLFDPELSFGCSSQRRILPDFEGSQSA